MNQKGDVERYILWFIVLLALLIAIVYLYYTNAWRFVENILIKELIK